MTTPHQTENHYFEVDREDTGLKFEGYENATDEEKTKMMLQIAKEANAEQKAMFETEKLPQADMIADDIFGNPTEWYCKNKVIALLKEERECLCKDKGVIELIEEAVEAERARIREGVEKLTTDGYGTSYQDALSDALRVINEEATDYDTALAEVKEITKTALDKIETDHFNVINKEEIPRNPLDQNKWM